MRRAKRDELEKTAEEIFNVVRRARAWGTEPAGVKAFYRKIARWHLMREKVRHA